MTVIAMATAAVGALITLPLLIGVERRARSLGLIDHPNDRSSHQQPTPRGGGVAVVTGTLVGWLASVVLGGTPLPPAYAGYIVGGLVIGTVSLLDDVRPLSPVVRLIAHAGAAAILLSVVAVPTAIELPGFGRVELGPFAQVCAALWIVGLTNTYNFMDGIDGLAGGQGVVAGLAWTAIGLWTQVPLVAGLGLAITVSCLLFLLRNWHPARIFLGDVGSAFLGFTFASLPLLAISSAQAAGADEPSRLPAIGALVVWPFLLDACWTLVRRLRTGENLLRPHRQHLYQRLILTGLGHSKVSLGYILLSAAGASAALLWGTHSRLWLGWLAVLVPLVLGLGLWGLVVNREADRRQLGADTER